jgi:tRNA(Ile)-lysidine synthase
VAHPFESRLSEDWSQEQRQNVVIVVAVSGGADSVALLRSLVSVSGNDTSNLVAAHFNHLLREAADADERFVVDLAKRLGVRCEVGRAATDLASLPGGSLESAARDARYEFLQATALATGSRYIATAHTADDQVETVLHRIIRGTGIAGLAGIPRTRELSDGITLIRPLLDFQRRECLAYLATLGQGFRTDASNDDQQFTRNRIRHELLPLLAKYNHDVDGALVRLASLASESTAVVSSLAEQLLDEVLCRRDQSELEFRCDGLEEANPFLVREMLKAAWNRMDWPLQAMSFEKWRELSELALSPTAGRTSLNLPGGVTATRAQRSVCLKRN